MSGSLDTSIRVWDVETGSCKHALMGHQSLTSGKTARSLHTGVSLLVSGMELKDNILVSGNADSTVKIWDILSGQCLQTLSGPNKHQSAVTCLQFNNKFVITSSDDGTVKLWDVKTGGLLQQQRTLQTLNNYHCRRFHPRSDRSGVWRVWWSRLEDSILAYQTGNVNNRDSLSSLIITVILLRFVLLALATEQKKPSSLCWISTPR